MEYERSDVDKRVFNRDTSRAILRNLMENGLTDASGGLVGKTIVFARSHAHAIHLEEVFGEAHAQTSAGAFAG